MSDHPIYTTLHAWALYHGYAMQGTTYSIREVLHHTILLKTYPVPNLSLNYP